MVEPKNWVKTYLGNLCDVKGGKRLPKGNSLVTTLTNYPYIRVADMTMGTVQLNDIHYVPDNVASFISDYRIYDTDLFISVAGTLGIVGEIPTELNGANLTENANKLCNIKCYKKFLMYALMSKEIQNIISDISTVGAQPKLALTRIKEFELLIPKNKEEQIAIATALCDIDELIKSLRKLIKKKKAIKQGVMQELLTGKKRLDGFSGEWKTTTLNKLCYLITKQTGFDYTASIKPNLIDRQIDNSIPMIQTKNFKGTKFEFQTDYYIPLKIAKKFEKIILDNKCLLFSIVGASVGNIGLYPGNTLSFCGGAIGIAKFLNEFDATFSFYYMNTEEGQKQIKSVTKGGGQTTITIEDIRKFSIPFPSTRERKEIANILSDMDSEIEKLEEKLKKYKQIKQGMMDELLSGKIRLI